MPRRGFDTINRDLGRRRPGSTQDGERIEGLSNDDIPGRMDRHRALASMDRERRVWGGRHRLPVVYVSRPERVSIGRLRDEKGVWALARLRDRVRRLRVQEDGRAVTDVDVDVPERGGERGVGRDGSVDDLVGVPVAPDDAALSREDACTRVPVRIRETRFRIAKTADTDRLQWRRLE